MDDLKVKKEEVLEDLPALEITLPARRIKTEPPRDEEVDMDFEERVRSILREHKFDRDEFVATLMNCRMNWEEAIEE
jgi:hypothetical protein